MADAIEANLAQEADATVGGRGYCSDANLAAMEEREIDAYIAPGRAKHAGEGEGGGVRVAAMRENFKAGGHSSPTAERAARAGVELAIKLVYTQQFLAAADLMPWLALGVFGRVVSWPLSFVQVAAGASGWFAATTTALFGTQALLTLWLVEGNGTIGAAYAFVASYALFLIAMLWVTRVLIGFAWSTEARKLIMVSTAFIVVGFVARYALSDFGSTIAGGVLTLAGMLFCLRGLAARLGRGHRIVKWLLIAPGGRYLLARVA